MRHQAIGVFDSGIGGLTVANAIKRLLPNESIIYVADDEFAPYGQLNEETLLARSIRMADSLVALGAKIIVVACNTATAHAVETLRMRFQVPIVAIEPAIKPARQQSNNHRVGVLATEYTVKSARFAKLIDEYKNDTTFIVVGCKNLASSIENNFPDTDKITPVLTPYLDKLFASNADTVVLGCTHYPFIRDLILDHAPYPINIIEPSDAVALQLKRVLTTNNLLNQQDHQSHQYYCTGDIAAVERKFRRILGSTVEVSLLSK